VVANITAYPFSPTLGMKINRRDHGRELKNCNDFTIPPHRTELYKKNYLHHPSPPHGMSWQMNSNHNTIKLFSKSPQREYPQSAKYQLLPKVVKLP
jgi:hypothetical protein